MLNVGMVVHFHYRFFCMEISSFPWIEPNNLVSVSNYKEILSGEAILLEHSKEYYTVCPRSSDPFYVVTHYT